jgi:hypothetical protein
MPIPSRRKGITERLNVKERLDTFTNDAHSQQTVRMERKLNELGNYTQEGPDVLKSALLSINLTYQASRRRWIRSKLPRGNYTQYYTFVLAMSTSNMWQEEGND